MLYQYYHIKTVILWMHCVFNCDAMLNRTMPSYALYFMYNSAFRLAFGFEFYLYYNIIFVCYFQLPCDDDTTFFAVCTLHTPRSAECTFECVLLPLRYRIFSAIYFFAPTCSFHRCQRDWVTASSNTAYLIWTDGWTRATHAHAWQSPWAQAMLSGIFLIWSCLIEFHKWVHGMQSDDILLIFLNLNMTSRSH